METSKIEARFKVSLKEGLFEINGSEAFVEKQIENFKEFIQSRLSDLKIPNPDSTAESSTVLNPPAAPSGSPLVKNAFPNILHFEGEKVKLLKTMPGTTTSKKAVNTALAYLWAKRSAGVEIVPYSEIRDLCQEQGCLDSSNFSSHMKGALQYIIVDGKAGSSAQTCKLTLPGINAAEELLKAENGS